MSEPEVREAKYIAAAKKIHGIEANLHWALYQLYQGEMENYEDKAQKELEKFEELTGKSTKES